MSKENAKIIGAYKGVIEINKTLYENFEDVRSKDETRFFLQTIEYDETNNALISTDGKRLYFVTVDDAMKKEFNSSGIVNNSKFLPAKLKNKFLLVPEKNDGQFLQWMKAYPKDAKEKLREFDFGLTTTKDSRIIYDIFMAVGNPIDLSYLNLLKKRDFTLCVLSHDKAVLFKLSENEEYVVMPILVNE